MTSGHSNHGSSAVPPGPAGASASAGDRTLAGRRVLVSGAGGFVGARLVARLLGAGAGVVALVRPGDERGGGEAPRRLRDLDGDLTLVRADLAARTDPGDAEAELAPVIDTVFHLAAAGASGQAPDPETVLATNVGGTLRMLQRAVAAGARRFVYCGSCFEYGQGRRIDEDAPLAPFSFYGASKSAGWLLARAHARRTELTVVGLRPFAVYGPGEAPSRLVPHVIRGALAGEAIELTPGRQIRDPVFVDDVVDAFVTAAVAPAAEVADRVFNVCSGDAVPVRDLVDRIVALVGRGEPRYGALPYRPHEPMELTGNPARAAARLGWRARTSLDEGLSRTVRRLCDPGRREHHPDGAAV